MVFVSVFRIGVSSSPPPRLGRWWPNQTAWVPRRHARALVTHAAWCCVCAVPSDTSRTPWCTPRWTCVCRNPTRGTAFCRTDTAAQGSRYLAAAIRRRRDTSPTRDLSPNSPSSQNPPSRRTRRVPPIRDPFRTPGNVRGSTCTRRRRSRKKDLDVIIRRHISYTVRGRPLTLSLTHSLRNARVPKDSVLSTHVRGGVPPKMLCSQTRDGALGRSRRRYRPASGPRPVATRGFSSPCSETSFLRR